MFKLNSKKINGIIKLVDNEGRLNIDLENIGLSKFNNKEIGMIL